jgi:hypothetical protein
MKAPQVAIVHDEIKELSWVLPRSSVVFHANALTNTPWVAQTLPHCTFKKRGKVSSKSTTHETTKFVGLHLSYLHQYIIKCLFIQTQPTWTLIDTVEATTLELWIYDPVYKLPFPSSILHLPLVASPGLILNKLSTIQFSTISIHEPGYKKL